MNEKFNLILIISISIITFSLTAMLFNNNEYFEIIDEEKVNISKERYEVLGHTYREEVRLQKTHYDYTLGLIGGAGTALVLSFIVYSKRKRKNET